MEIGTQRTVTNSLIGILLSLILGVPLFTYFYNTGYFEQFVDHSYNCENMVPLSRPFNKGVIVVKGVVFKVDIPDNLQQAQRGLMCRNSMQDNAGMLFVFAEDKDNQLWMKNTLIPLDMIFMDHLGVVVGIIRSAKPMSEKYLSVGIKSRVILELNGGIAARIDLKVGDRVAF